MSSQEYQSTSTPLRDFLNPDPETSFFRSWAIRARNPASAYSSSSDVSPGCRTPITSPISPRPLARRPRRREVPGRSTESHAHQFERGLYRRDATEQQSYLSQSNPGSPAYQPTPPRDRGSGDALAPRSSSNASSLAKRALSLVKGSVSAKNASAAQDTKLNKPPKSLAWKHESFGHYLEIRSGKKEDPDRAIAEAQDTTLRVHYGSNPTSHTAARTNKIIGHSKSKVSLRPSTTKSTDSSSPEGKPPKESLVDRTKRILGIKSAVSLTIEPSTRGRQRSTAETLDRTSAALRNLVELTPPSGSSTSNMSTASIGGKPKHHHVFRPHYHRHHTGHSSSSSVRRIMFGKPPVSTPNDECMYTGSDSQQYFRVELSAPDAPKYLPSEARRIGTPPLPESKQRGFFFDYNPPQIPSPPSSADPWPNEPMNTSTLQPRQYNTLRPAKSFGAQGPRSPAGHPRSPGGRPQNNDPDGVDWFRVKLALGQADEERGGFELHVPEHLPSSPLCPRHPKHKSGGKGVCVYHGRNKMGPDDVVVEREGLWR
ncbi:MAG: hypothetical protein Q9169_007537 [Polycauliona sp. 2 TL-2023]